METIQGTERVAFVLRAQRARLGLTQGECAERAGLSKKMVASAEQGAVNVSFATVDALCALYELSWLELGEALDAVTDPHADGFDAKAQGRRLVSEEDRENIRTLLLAGELNGRQIAEKVGFSPNVVSQIKSGLNLRSITRSDEERERLEQAARRTQSRRAARRMRALLLWDEQGNACQVARDIGAHHVSLYTWRNRYVKRRDPADLVY